MLWALGYKDIERFYMNEGHAALLALELFTDRTLYDQDIPDWRLDSFSLRYAVGIPLHAIWRAHEQAKRRPADEVNRRVPASIRIPSR